MIWLTIIMAALPVEVRWNFETEQGHNEGTVIVFQDAWNVYQVAVSATGEYIPSTKGIVAALYAGVDSPFPSEYLTYNSKCEVIYRRYEEGVLGPVYSYETEVPSAEGGPEQLHVIDGYQYIDQNARIFNINKGTLVKIQPCDIPYQKSIWGYDYCDYDSENGLQEIGGITNYNVSVKDWHNLSYDKYDDLFINLNVIDLDNNVQARSGGIDGANLIGKWVDNLFYSFNVQSRWIQVDNTIQRYLGNYKWYPDSQPDLTNYKYYFEWLGHDHRGWTEITVTGINDEYYGIDVHGNKTRIFRVSAYADEERIIYYKTSGGYGTIPRGPYLHYRDCHRAYFDKFFIEVHYGTLNCNLVYVDLKQKIYQRCKVGLPCTMDDRAYLCDVSDIIENEPIAVCGSWFYISAPPEILKTRMEINRNKGIEEYPFLVKAEEILGNIGSHVNVSEQELSNLIEGFVGSANEEKWGDIEDSWRELIIEYQELQDIKEYQLSNDYLINIGEVTEIGTRVGVWETEMAAVKGLIEEYQSLLWRNSRYEEWHVGNRADVLNTYSSQFKGQVLEELDSMELSVITMLSGISGLEIDKKDGLLGALNEVLIQIGVLKFGYESFADVSYDIAQLQQSINTVDSELRGVIEDWFLGWDSELTTMKGTLSSIVEAQGALDENIGSLTASAVADRLYSGTQSFLEGLSYETEVNESSSVGFMGSLPEMELNVSGGEENYVLSFDVLGNQYSFSLQPYEKIMEYLEVLRLVINVLMTGKFMVFCYKLVKGI